MIRHMPLKIILLTVSMLAGVDLARGQANAVARWDQDVLDQLDAFGDGQRGGSYHFALCLSLPQSARLSACALHVLAIATTVSPERRAET